MPLILQVKRGGLRFTVYLELTSVEDAGMPG